jgi:predicted Ser/Thr protein kinase/cytochrome c-type biogenesis protein CcmH/NrfG
VAQTIDEPATSWDDASAAEEDDGDTLGEYKIVREIGRGAMGVVYEAIQASLNRRVALKVLLDDFTLDQGSIDRFKREAESAAKLHHENIVPIFDVGEIDDVNYYAMEFVEGRTLDQLLTEESLTPERAVKIAVQIGRALDYAHQKGVVHRDIKPANVMVDKADRVHLMDFGLAKQKGMNTITATDALLGTPMYMSPEQATQRGRVTGKSDIYSLGVTLFEALTLEPPFRGDNFAALVVQIRDVNPPKPSKVNPKIPAALDRVVLKSLAKKPEDRYATAGEMADDLERFLHGEKVEARAPSSRPRWLVPAAVLLVLAGGGVGAVAAFGGFGPRGPSPEELERERRQKAARERRDKAAALLKTALAARQASPPEWGAVVGPLDQAVELVPDDPELRLARGEALLARGGEGDAARALEDLRPAAEKRGEDAGVLLLLAKAARGAGDQGEAVSAATRVLDLLAGAGERAQLRQRQDAFLVLGDAFAGQGQHARAREAFQNARDVKGLVAPGEALFGCAWMQVELSQWDEALATLKELDRNLPDYPGAHLMTGRAHAGLGKLDEALAEYEKEAKGPEDRWNADAATRATAVRAELATRDPYAAATPSDLPTADRYNERGVQFFNEAQGYLRQNQRQRAAELFRKAASDFGKGLEKSPDAGTRATLAGNRCMAVAQLGDAKQLARDGAKLVEQAAPHPRGRWTVRQAFLEVAQQPQLLLEICDAAVATADHRADVLVLRAEAKIKLQRAADALVDLDKAYGLNARLDGVAGLRGLLLAELAARAPDAEQRRQQLVQARDLLREAEAATHWYRNEAVKKRLPELEQELGG